MQPELGETVSKLLRIALAHIHAKLVLFPPQLGFRRVPILSTTPITHLRERESRKPDNYLLNLLFTQ